MTEALPPTVVVLGSVHMDLVAAAPRFPAPGESVSGTSFAMSPGGKGGNQACQFALAGVRTFMATRLGKDTFGRALLAALEAKGVDTSHVVIDETAATGASTVFAAQDDYMSIIVRGAAGRLGEADIAGLRPVLEAADALVIQLELDASISGRAAAIAASEGRRVVLNASPAPDRVSDLPRDLWRNTSVLVVNAFEAGRLLGRPFRAEEVESDLRDLSRALDIALVVVTLGADGAVALAEGRVHAQPAFRVRIVDAVGAGDAFLGTFVTAILEARTPGEALRRGAAAAALALSHAGVYDALPSREAVDAFLANGPATT